jgi:hypothetical protein
MMQVSDMVKAELILGIAFLVAALLNGGVYQIVIAGTGSGGSQDLAGDTPLS